MDTPVTKTAKVTISLPEAMLKAADEAGAREHRSRSELIREALRWYLRIGQLPVEEATPEDLAAIAAGRAEHARGETLSLAHIQHDLATRVREEGA
jgi:metal-responsive CopG/Arc/MetJ family transcriptional regulator